MGAGLLAVGLVDYVANQAKKQAEKSQAIEAGKKAAPQAVKQVEKVSTATQKVKAIPGALSKYQGELDGWYKSGRQKLENDFAELASGKYGNFDPGEIENRKNAALIDLDKKYQSAKNESSGFSQNFVKKQTVLPNPERRAAFNQVKVATGDKSLKAQLGSSPLLQNIADNTKTFVENTGSAAQKGIGYLAQTPQALERATNEILAKASPEEFQRRNLKPQESGISRLAGKAGQKLEQSAKQYEAQAPVMARAQNNPNLRNVGQFTGSVAPYVAAEVLSGGELTPALIGRAAAPLLRQIPNQALRGIASKGVQAGVQNLLLESAISPGRQYAETGKISPEQTVQDLALAAGTGTVLGGVLGALRRRAPEIPSAQIPENIPRTQSAIPEAQPVATQAVQSVPVQSSLPGLQGSGLEEYAQFLDELKGQKAEAKITALTEIPPEVAQATAVEPVNELNQLSTAPEAGNFTGRNQKGSINFGAFFDDAGLPERQALNTDLEGTLKNIRPKAAAEVIQDLAQRDVTEIDKARRGVQTFEQTSELASLLGKDEDFLKDFIGRKEGTAYNAEQLKASTNLLTSSALEISDIAKAIQSGADDAGNRLKLAQAIELHSAIQRQFLGARAEAGRALGILRSTTKANKQSLQDLKDVLESIGYDDAYVQDLSKKITQLTGNNSPASSSAVNQAAQAGGQLPGQAGQIPGQNTLNAGGSAGQGVAGAVGATNTANQAINQAAQVSNMVRQVALLSGQKSFGAKVFDALNYAFVNSILSGPATHLVNISQNASNIVGKVIEDSVAAGIGSIGRKADRVYWSEVGAELNGIVKGIMDGAEALKTYYTTGNSVFAGNQIGSNVNQAIPNIAERILPTGVLQASDEFFKAVNYRIELNRLAWKKAHGQGLNGNALKTAIQQFTINPTDDLIKAAQKEAQYRTYTNDSKLASSINRIKNQAPILNFVIPFVKTPVNVVKYTGERTPFAFLNKDIQAQLRSGGAAKDIALARISTGSAFMGFFALLAGQGKVTGAGPKDPVEYKAWARNNQPYSIRVGNKWISYNRLPGGQAIGLTADLVQAAKQAKAGNLGEAAGQVLAGFVNNVANQTFLSGLTDTANLIADPKRYGDRYIQNMAPSLAVPYAGNLVNYINKAGDPQVREFRGVGEKIQSRIPGQAQQLPAKYDEFGQPVKIETLAPESSAVAALERFASPVRVKSINNDPVSLELQRVAANVSGLDKKIQFKGGSVEIPAEMYSKYQKQIGQEVYKALDKVLKATQYSQLDDATRKDVLQKVAGEVKSAYSKQILKELLPQLMKSRSEKRSLVGTGKKPGNIDYSNLSTMLGGEQ